MKKNRKSNDSKITRRAFVRHSGYAAVGFAGLVNSIPHLLLPQSAMGQTINLNDYKALVVIFLNGGNDSNNMLIPASNHPSRPDYDNGRGVLAIPSDQLHLINYPTSINQDYGVHPSLQSMSELFNNGDLSFVANVGTMVEPVPDRQAYLNKTVKLPPKLFSHSDQQLQWQSSIPDQLFNSGWGGRITDSLNPIYNNNANIPMSISLAGVSRLLAGNEVNQYIVSPNGVVQFSSAGYGSNYSSALDSNGSYINNDYGRRLKAFEDILNYEYGHLLEEGYNQVVRQARETEVSVGNALQEAVGSGIDFDLLFQNAQNGLGNQLKMITKLIAGRISLGNQRQLFFCSMGGYDNHAALLGTHANLMNQLGSSLKAFSETLKALNVNEDVVAITHSDFSRTMTPNKEDPLTAGSDHAWGGHQIVMGGPVNGGNIFGFFPSLKINADLDAGVDGRGRWIPTTSVEQYQAITANWLGISQNELSIIFPNLERFENPFDTAANLGYISP